jgi:hypothetical protein
MQQQVTIKYADGTDAVYQVIPPDYAKWEMTTKKVISQFGGIWDILYVTHSAMKREAGGKPTKSLDIWMESVVDFEVGGDDPKAIQGEA